MHLQSICREATRPPRYKTIESKIESALSASQKQGRKHGEKEKLTAGQRADEVEAIQTSDSKKKKDGVAKERLAWNSTGAVT